MLQVIAHLKEFANAKAQYYRLKAIQSISYFFSSVIAIMLILLLALFFLMFGGLTLSMYLNDKLDSSYYGFAITGGIYVLLLVVCGVFAESFIKKPIMNIFIRAFLRHENNNYSE